MASVAVKCTIVLVIALPLALAERSPSFPSCEKLEQEYKKLAKYPQIVINDGIIKNVALTCGSAPACAASHMLRAILVHTQLFRNITVIHFPLYLRDYVKAEFEKIIGTSSIFVAMSAAWVPHLPIKYEVGHTYGLAAPSVAEFGASSVPARRRLFVRLSPSVASIHCASHMGFRFYANNTLLRNCHFTNSTSENVPVYVVGDPLDEGVLAELKTELKQRAIASAVPLDLQDCSRADLLALLQSNRSLLFLDYDIWEEQPGVATVQPPPCVTENSNCSYELDPALSLRVGQVFFIQDDKKQILYTTLDRFWPSQLDLRYVLEREINGSAIEEAACDWAMTNKDRVNTWRKPDSGNFFIIVFYCQDVSENHSRLHSKLNNYIHNNNATERQIERIDFTSVDCSIINEMEDKLEYVCVRPNRSLLVGVIVPEAKGTADVAKMANKYNVPLVVHTVAGEERDAWLLAPRTHSSRALAHFISTNQWTRLAVISESTILARSFVEDLENYSIIVLDLHLDLLNLESIFSELRSANARIIFINANSTTAVRLLKLAVEQEMTDDEKYVWIVREWYPSNATHQVRHYTISPWSQSAGTEAEGAPALRELAADEPQQYSASLVDALWLLAVGIDEVWRRKPETRNNMRHEKTIRELESVLHGTKIDGSQQHLQFKNHSLEASWINLEEWRGEQHALLATWRVNMSAPACLPRDSRRSGRLAAPPHDGASACWLRGGGGPFAPACLDWACAAGLLALLLLLAAGWLALRHARRRLERRDRELLLRLRAGRAAVGAALADWLVDRAALLVREELGAGQFGRVNLALLRVPGRAPRVIAVKRLHDGAAPSEESDFLREACTLSSLTHPYVLRFVGVCVEGGPPLMLTEVAFFGNLLEYLRARRHLTVVTEPDPAATDAGEATHVSAESLTRLVREAASALAYLSSRGIVHRDVRAANCLVDSTRSLKLADYGMARETGATEYVCVRRALMPVLWMAPESLMHGVFSSASDVWALGVLVLEVVTLGARPFGRLAPPAVLRHVSAGGRAPLPPDAGPAARGLTRLCWRRDAAERPAAREVEAFLAARPRALAPALCGLSDSDSGFGDSSPVSLTPSYDSY